MENGEPIQSPAQLISGNCYVAANKEKFKKCIYLWDVYNQFSKIYLEKEYIRIE